MSAPEMVPLAAPLLGCILGAASHRQVHRRRRRKRPGGEPSTGTSARKAEKIAEGGKYAEGEQIAETKKWPFLDA